MTGLPTREQMFANCAQAIIRASGALSEARDWLRSDWSPELPLTPSAAQARQSVLTGIAESKALIDAMQREISEARQSIRDES